jgi:hypothetical protein
MEAHSSSGRHGHSGLLAQRLVTAGAALICLVVFLGCMSLNFGTRTEVIQHDDVSYMQTGTATVPGGQEVEVYYPVPYASPPNLVLSSDWDQCVVVQQKQDHFRVKNNRVFATECKWTARGLKVPPPVAPGLGPPVIVPPPVPPPAGLPAEPIPVSATTKP